MTRQPFPEPASARMLQRAIDATRDPRRSNPAATIARRIRTPDRLRAYLDGGTQAEDFADLLPRYFVESRGQPAPAAARGSRARKFFSTPDGRAIRHDFVLWVENNVFIDLMRGDDARDRPSYMYFDGAEVVPGDTWVVHFSDAADYVARQGFRYGSPDAARLGLTRHRVDEEVVEPGWNFGFSLDSEDAAQHAAKDDFCRYGEHALLFQSAGVSAHHSGDDEQQVIFWGPAVRHAVLITSVGECAWSVSDKDTGAELRRGSFSDVARWAVDQVERGDDRLLRALPIPAAPRPKSRPRR